MLQLNELSYVSPSQINTWSQCQRKWSFSRQRPKSNTPATLFGSRVHTILEDYLIEGKVPSPNTDEGRCAIAGLGNIPMPGTCQVEAKLDIVHDSVAYTGRIDFHTVTPEGVTIGDHKTCKSLTYAKTKAELLDDPQRIIYSHWAAITYDVSEVTAMWVYYQRKPPESRVVSFTEPASLIEMRFQELHRKYSLPIIQAQNADPFDLPQSLDHCDAYGGCPYRKECHAQENTWAKMLARS